MMVMLGRSLQRVAVAQCPTAGMLPPALARVPVYTPLPSGRSALQPSGAVGWCRQRSTTVTAAHSQAASSGRRGPKHRPLHVGTATCLETPRVAAAPRHTSSAPSRLRVAVDVDEVLGRFVFALNQFCEVKYSMRHSVQDYWIYEFAKIWGVDQDRSNYIVHEFFKSRVFQDLPVIPGAYESLVRLSEGCDLVVVTSRQHVIQDQTLDWIDRHYPGIFQEVYFGNHWSLEGVSRRKSDICKTVGASVLIDDNPSYATECAAAGIQVLLYDWQQGYPWSKLKPGQQHPLIKVVSDWEDVERELAVLSPGLALREPAALEPAATRAAD